MALWKGRGTCARSIGCEGFHTGDPSLLIHFQTTGQTTSKTKTTREVKLLAQGHTARKWRAWGSNPGWSQHCMAPKYMCPRYSCMPFLHTSPW